MKTFFLCIFFRCLLYSLQQVYVISYAGILSVPMSHKIMFPCGCNLFPICVALTAVWRHISANTQDVSRWSGRDTLESLRGGANVLVGGATILCNDPPRAALRRVRLARSGSLRGGRITGTTNMLLMMMMSALWVL